MSSHRILRSLALSCACLLCASAIAAPVDYVFSGYFATRNTEAAQILPAFSMGPEGFTGSVRFDTHRRRIWRAPVRGQLPAGQPGQQIPPEDFRTLNLAQLDPSGWQLTVLAFPGSCYPEYAAVDTLQGQLGPFVPLASWDRSASDFANGPPGWQPKSGTWMADNGQYRNTSNQQAAISVLGTAAAPDYRIDARVRLQWSASGNRGGLVDASTTSCWASDARQRC